MKTSILKPTVDYFTIPSLVSLTRKIAVAFPGTSPAQRAVGLSTADISEASNRASMHHGLKINRSPRLLVNK